MASGGIYRAAKQRGIYPPLAIFLTDRLTFLYTFNAHRKRMMKRDLKISKERSRCKRLLQLKRPNASVACATRGFFWSVFLLW